MEILNENNKKLWEDFILKKEDIAPQHLIEWKDAIEKSYKNCKSHYYLNVKQGGIRTIFPLFLTISVANFIVCSLPTQSTTTSIFPLPRNSVIFCFFSESVKSQTKSAPRLIDLFKEFLFISNVIIV